MDGSEGNCPVVMLRPHLDGLIASLPKDFTLRWFRAGDEQLWLDIHRQTERYRPVTALTFEEQFGTDAVMLGQRQCFLMDQDRRAIATATAWVGVDGAKSSMGRVHWLAVLPQFQGRGLGKVLVAAVCQRLKELGHASAFLRTSSARLAAIALYLKCGFLPVIRNPEEATLWKTLVDRVRDPRLE